MSKVIVIPTSKPIGLKNKGKWSYAGSASRLQLFINLHDFLLHDRMIA
jgi:hypothetical protein